MSWETDRFAALAQLDQETSDQALAIWSTLDPADMQSSFVDSILARLLYLFIRSQFKAATIAATYVEGTVAELDIPAGPTINPAAYSGVASDGRSLSGLLTQPLIRTYTMQAEGATTYQARKGGAKLLDKIAVTQVQDTARAAETSALAANLAVAGYIRVVEPGACSRCIVLAGRFYKWNQGFRRHERCRCSHKLVDTETEPQSPRELFDAMSKARQNEVFGIAKAESIRQGADISQVVNAVQGLKVVGIAGKNVRTTNVGTGKGSYARTIRQAIDQARGNPRSSRSPRLMPEEIIKQAKGDRASARKLLITNGYVVGNIDALVREVLAN